MKKIFRHLILITTFILMINSIAFCDVSMFIRAPNNVKAGDSYNVEITINKNGIQGFSKFEIKLPYGFEVEPLECSEATFMYKDNKVKFIWMELPSTESVSISYKATVPVHYKGEKRIEASFHYIDKNEKHAQSFTTLLDIINDLPNTSPLKRNIEKDYYDMLAGIQYKTRQVVFRLQVGAYTKEVPEEFLQELCPAHFRIKNEYIDGLYKYYIGQFYSLEAAKIFKKYSGIKDSFVTAYYKGKRITIQEAKAIIKKED